MTTNPSHILIARNSRGTNNPSASLSSPTETHAAAAGIFRSSTSQWMLEECETDDLVSEPCSDEDDESIEIDEAFTKHSRFPGTVKIVVEGTTFWSVLLRINMGSSSCICNTGPTRKSYSLPLHSLRQH